MAATKSPSRPATRRRGKALEQAILDATVEQLRTVGYVGLTMDAVAAAAGTGKAALYRRWANRDELLADALRSVLPDPGDIAMTGRVRDDLLAVLRCIRDTIAVTHGTVFQVVRSEVEGAGGLVHAVVGDEVMDPCHALILEILHRGVASGRVRPEACSTTVATVGPAMIVHYVIHQGPVAPDSYLTTVVDDVLVPLVSLR